MSSSRIWVGIIPRRDRRRDTAPAGRAELTSTNDGGSAGAETSGAQPPESGITRLLSRKEPHHVETIHSLFLTNWAHQILNTAGTSQTQSLPLATLTSPAHKFVSSRHHPGGKDVLQVLLPWDVSIGQFKKADLPKMLSRVEASVVVRHHRSGGEDARREVFALQVCDIIDEVVGRGEPVFEPHQPDLYSLAPNEIKQKHARYILRPDAPTPLYYPNTLSTASNEIALDPGFDVFISAASKAEKKAVEPKVLLLKVKQRLFARHVGSDTVLAIELERRVERAGT